MEIKGIDEEFKKLSSSRQASTSLQSDVMVSTMKNEIVAMTPIDTGLARASWEIQKLSNMYNVMNPVPYIQYLNQGSSKQAPAHFVEAIALKYGKPVGTIVDIID